MSLSLALSSSLSSIKVAQESIAVHSHNIANADTEGYIRQQVEQTSLSISGVGQGVAIKGITTDLDYFLQSSLREQTSKYSASTTEADFATRIQNLYGKPDGNNLSADLTNFFNSFQQLSSNIDNFSLKQNATNSLSELLDKISYISSNLQNERFKADQKLSSDIATINSLVTETNKLNNLILKFPKDTSGYAEIEQERETALQKISEYIDISVVYNKDNQAYIYTGKGAALLDHYPYTIEYEAVSSVDTFKNELPLNAILVRPSTGNIKSSTHNSIDTALVTKGISGKSGSIVSSISSGNLESYIKLRDEIIPNLLSQLDSLSFSLTNEVNKIHNNGASFPPPGILTGTTEVSYNSKLFFEGNVRIAVLNDDGTPVESPYEDEEFFRPLNIDLSSLTNNSDNGKFTVKNLINEINYFYGPPQNRVAVGDLRNINFVSRNTTTDSNSSNAVFDFELDSISQEGATFTVENISISNGAVITKNFPTDPINVEGGDLFRTKGSNSVEIDFTNASGGPYTLTASVKVENEDGSLHTADINYIINADGNEDINHRFLIDGLTKTSDEDSNAVFIEAPVSNRFAIAEIVNSEGNIISDNYEKGFLQIRTADNTNTSIVIDELDSKNIDLNSPEGLKNRRLSHFFGLNNIIKDNLYVKNSSQEISLEKEIASNPTLLSTGKLSLSNQEKSLYTYELGSGDNRVLLDISSLNNNSVRFQSSQSIPSVTTTFSNYTADVISFVSTYSYNTDSEEKTEELALLGLKETFNADFGVDSDIELASIIELENNFRASVQIISMVRELFNVLANSF